MPIYYPVPGVSMIPAKSTRSSLDLLTLPFAFSQSPLLSASKFITEAKLRGLRIDHDELQTFHQRGVLVPLFRVHSRQVNKGALVDHARDGQERGPSWQVFHAADLGRLTDPAMRRFAPWPSARHDPGVYYSRYQLLSLRGLPSVMATMKVTRTGGVPTWQLPRLQRRELIEFARDRALAIVLEALSARYLPAIMQIVSSPTTAMYQMLRSGDPQDEGSFLQPISTDLLRQQAEFLLAQNHSFDPLGSWNRVVRIADPRRWSELRNDALQANDARVAAELLLRFVEDEASHGRTNPLAEVSKSWWAPLHDRLKGDTRERSETIMDFRLSDRPAVYVALEGQTEITLARKLLEVIGYEQFSTWVDLVDLNGIGADLALLARSVAVPQVDPNGYVGARITAPLTALVVATDPERKHATDADRALSLERMIGAVLASLPPDLRTAVMRADLHHLIHLRTWPAEFEFAHFTDHALAVALRKDVPGAPPLVELKRHLATCRATGGKIDDVWKKWKVRPSKVRLAEILWPDLRRRVQNPKHTKAIPLVEVLDEALAIARHIRSVRELNVPAQSP